MQHLSVECHCQWVNVYRVWHEVALDEEGDKEGGDVMDKKQNRSRRKVDQKRIICVFFFRRNYDEKCRSRSLLKIIICFKWSSVDKVSGENNVDRYFEIHLLRGQAKQLF